MSRGLALLAWLSACAEEPVADTASGIDTGPCADAPPATWDSFGRGFVTQHCQVCHASTSPDRHDAPEDVTFDTEADVAALRERIVAVAVGEAPTMPPTGGVSDDDRALLASWMACGI